MNKSDVEQARTKLFNQNSNIYHEVCRRCHGQGKLIKPLSRKAHLRHKRRLHVTADISNENDVLSNQTNPVVGNLEPCSACHSSGLVHRHEELAYKESNVPHIAIIGGGIAGLALAIACRHRGIPHTVFERDANFLQRRQGYGLTLQQASKALKHFGNASDDILREGITSTKHVVHTIDGTVVGEWGIRKWGRPSDKKEPKRQNIHIARQALRYHLLKAADQSNIQWDSRLVEYRETDHGVEMTIQTGGKLSAKRADLLVGADGIHSQVRRQLIGDSTTPLRYLGCLVVLGICPLPSLGAAALSNPLLDGATVFQTADGSTRMYMMPYSSTEYMWQLSFPLEEDDSVRISTEGPQALKNEAVQRCGLWHAPIPEILQATPLWLVSGYPVYDRALLELNQLRVSQFVTLIGDACHPMSPFKGQGANQALLDALSLANSIYLECYVHKTGMQEALCSFEEEMLTRSSVKVQASAEAAKFLHSAVAIQEGNVTRGAAHKASCGLEESHSSM